MATTAMVEDLVSAGALSALITCRRSLNDTVPFGVPVSFRRLSLEVDRKGLWYSAMS